jgi:hypothetical protein
MLNKSAFVSKRILTLPKCTVQKLKKSSLELPKKLQETENWQ